MVIVIISVKCYIAIMIIFRVQDTVVITITDSVKRLSLLLLSM